MATPTIGELLALLEEQRARIERLEAAAAGPAVSGTAGRGEAGNPGEAAGNGPRAPGMTRRGVVAAAAAGTAGLVGAMLAEPGVAGAAALSGPASFTSATATPAVKASNTGTGSAILATAKTATVVVANQSSAAAAATAVNGVITNATGAGTGVAGTSPKGAGVSGSSNTGIGVTGSSGGVAGVQGTITSTSPSAFSAGVRGINNGTGGGGIGVYGSQAGSGFGVFGTAPSGAGVVGATNSGTGVEATATSGTGVSGSSSTGIGVTGSSDSTAAGQPALLGTITSTAPGASSAGVVGINHGTGAQGFGVDGFQNGSGVGVHGSTGGNGMGVLGFSPAGTGVCGETNAASGNWAIFGQGNIGATGTKSAVVPAQDGKGHLTLYCLESPECWFEDFGAARLSGGSATVRIDPAFAQTIHTAEYHVFVQAEGECQGLSVRDKSATAFVVRELGGGTSDVPFAYRIAGRRRDVSAPRLNRVTPPKAPRAQGR